MEKRVKQILLTLFFVIALGYAFWLYKDDTKLVEAGYVESSNYTYPELGWTFKVPKGFQIDNVKEAERLEEKGLRYLEENKGLEIDNSKMQHLISFQKDQTNRFLSSANRLDSLDLLSYEQDRKEIYDMVYEAMLFKGFLGDTLIGNTTIAGIRFETFQMTIRNDQGKFLFEQLMFNALINGYDFLVIIYSNNLIDKRIMLDAFQNSKFDKIDASSSKFID
jgi:hypothetical protein